MPQCPRLRIAFSDKALMLQFCLPIIHINEKLVFLAIFNHALHDKLMYDIAILSPWTSHCQRMPGELAKNKRSSRVLCCQVQFSHHHHIRRKNTLRNCFSILSEITLHFHRKLKQNSFEMNNKLKNQILNYTPDDWLTLAYQVIPWPTRNF